MLHRNREYSGQLGALDFVGGVAQRGLEGIELNRYVINLGKYLEAAEPWDGGSSIETAKNFEESVAEAREVREQSAPEPSVPDVAGFSPSPEDDYDILAKPDLQDLAEAKGLDFDRRWGAPRLREFLREAEHAGC